MKKIIVIAFVLSLLAAPVFAFTTATAGNVTLGGEVICVLSKNVSLGGVSAVNQFAAASAHSSGSSQFGTTSQSTSIYKNSFTGTLTVPTVSDTGAFTGWSTM